MPRIDDLFNTSFDQLIEHLFQVPSSVPSESPGFSSDNIGDYIELYREKKNLELRQRKLKKMLSQKNAVIIHLKEQILNHIAEKDSLKMRQVAAEQAKERRTQFLARVSHDLRTPINGISGIASLLKEDILNPEQQELITLIEKSSQSLSALIDDLLDYTKIEAGAFKLEQVDFVLEETVKDCVDLLTFQAHDKDLFLDYKMDSRLPEIVSGDPLRLRQVLINLIGNALKFTSRGGVSISVVPESQSEKDMVVRFQVKDTGIGISEDQQQTLFDSYVQADTSTSRNFGGTGLGLTISRELAHLMGGQIGAYSNKERGSTFWFTALFGCNTSKKEQSNRNNTTGTGLKRNRPEPIRVLLVEDDPITQKVSSQLMQRSGNAVVEIADNGLDAIQKLQSGNFDLVLMDMQMPEMDGIEAARCIRKPDLGIVDSQIPIIAMTANKTVADREKCLAAGMNGFVSKPLRTEELEQMIDDLAAGQFDTGSLHAPEKTLDELPVLDEKELDQLQRDLGEKFKSLVEMFVEHLPERVQAIRAASAAGDVDALQAAAHKLRGNCASFHAEKLFFLCEQIEKSVDCENPVSEIELSRLETEAARVGGFLRTRIREA